MAPRGHVEADENVVRSSMDAPEGGWVLVPHAHGKGYATEAMTAVLDWIDKEQAPARTMCIIAPENAPSIRVAHKIGYRLIAETTYKEWPTLMYERNGSIA